MRLSVLFTTVFVITTAGHLQASPCMMVAPYDIQAEQALAVWRQGEHKEVIQYAIDDHTGAKSFCLREGYCYPATVSINGRKVVALRMTGCRIKPGEEPYDDLNSTSYTVESAPLRLPVNPSSSQRSSTNATPVVFTQLLFGKCIGQSSVTFSGFSQDATSSKRAFRCDRAMVEFFDRQHKRLRISFPASLNSEESSGLGFTGVRPLHGQTVNLSTMSVGIASKLTVTDSACKLFPDGNNLKGIVCQANYVGVGKYDVTVVFEASPGQSIGDDDEGP